MTPIKDGRKPGRTSKSVGGGQHRRSGRNKRSPAWVKIALGMLGLASIVGAVGVVLAFQVSSVRAQLEQVMDLLPQLRTELESGNHDAAELTFITIQEETSDARAITTAPLWKGASSVPVIGANFSAVREIAVSADDIALHAVAPLMDKYDSLNWQAVSISDGRVDLTELQDAEPSISTAANTVRLSYERLSSINLSTLLPELAEPVGAATKQLEEVASALDTASSAAQLLPAMLGAEGARSYLVLVQNSAETRATGGIPGALAVLHTDDGRITLSEQSSAVALGTFRPMLDVDPEQVAIYTGRLGTQMQNVNLTPHFPTGAYTAKQMWEDRHPGQTIDGVIALDPVVLSHLLEATGPVDLTEPQVLDIIRGTKLPSMLSEGNVIPTLLSDVYREIKDPETQDVYFAAVAGRIFSSFTSGHANSAQLVKALGASTEENRLRLWSTHPTEQNIIDSTPLSGSVTGPNNGGSTFGVYFNDGTGAKMDYYAKRSVQLLQACPSGDYSEYTVRVTVTNTAPEDAATILPEYVTGNGVFGVAPGRIRTNYVAYGPAQSFVETATVNGEPVIVGSGKHGQRPVGSVQMEVGPNETAVLEMTFSRVVQDSEPRLQVTPTLHPPENSIRQLQRVSCS